MYHMNAFVITDKPTHTHYINAVLIGETVGERETWGTLCTFYSKFSNQKTAQK